MSRASWLQNIDRFRRAARSSGRRLLVRRSISADTVIRANVASGDIVFHDPSRGIRDARASLPIEPIAWRLALLLLHQYAREHESGLQNPSDRRIRNGRVPLSGDVDREHANRLEELLANEANDRTILDLKDVALVDRMAVQLLALVEERGVRLVNCPGYVRS